MSIVNEALKKASRFQAKKEWLKSSGREQRVLAVGGSSWRRPFSFAIALMTLSLLAFASWWVYQNLTVRPAVSKAPQAGKIHAASGVPVSGVKSPEPLPQASKKADPAIPDQYQKGLGLYREKRYKEAQEIFASILKKEPRHAAAHNNLGLAYHAQGKEEEAVVEYLTALRLDPNLAEAMNNLGLLYDQQGRAEEALNLYDRALKVKPDYSEAHLNYAIMLERLGYLGEARQHYERFLSLAPSDLSDVIVTVQARLPTLP